MRAPAAPTERQLRYLRTLASRTATTFASPTTRQDASREIERLLSLSRPRAQGAEEHEWGTDEKSEYATAVDTDEVMGFGSSARWRSRPGGRTQRPRGGEGHEPRGVRIGSYRVSAGERVLIAERSGDHIRVRDIPTRGNGASYLIEQLSAHDGLPPLRALIADYVQRARQLDEVPMAPGALEQILGSGATR
jgi:hypothetical protein